MSKKILFAFIIFAICFFVFSPVLAVEIDDTTFGLKTAAGAAELSQQKLTVSIGNVIAAVLSLLGVIFFTLMIYGGFLWMTAKGSEETTKKALETILAAVVGIIIVLASYAATNFVFTSLK